jgi:hypothetical protein
MVVDIVGTNTSQVAPLVWRNVCLFIEKLVNEEEEIVALACIF